MDQIFFSYCYYFDSLIKMNHLLDKWVSSKYPWVSGKTKQTLRFVKLVTCTLEGRRATDWSREQKMCSFCASWLGLERRETTVNGQVWWLMHICSLSIPDKSLEMDLMRKAGRASWASLGQDQHMVGWQKCFFLKNLFLQKLSFRNCLVEKIFQQHSYPECVCLPSHLRNISALCQCLQTT